MILKNFISATCTCDLIILVTTIGEGMDVDGPVNRQLSFHHSGAVQQLHSATTTCIHVSVH